MRSSAITTYEDIWRFEPRRLVNAASIDDIRAAVADATSSGLRVRAMGFGNSWAAHVVTRDVLVNISRLNTIHTIDSTRRTVVVDGGVRLGDLTRVLAEKNLSLPSLSFLPDVTIGGAIATATHGTSPNWGTLSDFVCSMDVVLASGEVKRFGPDSPPDEFRAARVAIGMLGVIVRLELQIVERPWVRFSQQQMDLSTFRERLPALLSKYEHIWVNWTLGLDQVSVDLLEKRSTAAPGFHPYSAIWRPSNRRVVQLLNQLGVSTSTLLQWRDRLVGLLKGSSTGTLATLRGSQGQRFMSMQYALPVSQLGMAIDRIRSSDFAARNQGRLVEMKFLKHQDFSYLGPNSDGDAVGFNLWWLVDDSEKFTIFEPFEALMTNMKARPHWGKAHSSPSVEYVRSVYPRWAEFESVRARFDPTGTFSIFKADSSMVQPRTA